jgi:hypothetical protein
MWLMTYPSSIPDPPVSLGQLAHDVVDAALATGLDQLRPTTG